MITNFPDIFSDFLQNENICCLYCGTDGYVRHISRGMEMRYPRTFQVNDSIWQYVSSLDAQTELARELPTHGYYITPEFLLYGKSCFFCCLDVNDPAQHKKGMLCLLELAADNRPDAAKLTRCRSLVDQFNSSLMCGIIERSRKLSDPTGGEAVARMSEAAIRNSTLLSVFENEMRIGSKEDRIVMTQLCKQMMEQCNAALAVRSEKLNCGMEVSRRVYYLDLECFLGMFAALLALYHLTGVPQALSLSLSEQKSGGRFTLRADGVLPAAWDEQQDLLAQLLKSILEMFASHYSGNAFCSVMENRLIVGMTFVLKADHGNAEQELFLRSPLQFAILDRALPLLRYADR